jgi:hypothetical protein
VATAAANLAGFAISHEEFMEFDLNPVITTSAEVTAPDALILAAHRCLPKA